jgi:AcrR family transcriptional regulator
MPGLRLRKDALRSRRSIVAAAEKLFTDDAQASFAEIALTAGVSQATVYRHFADRQALLVALMETSLDRIEEQVEAWDIDADSFEDLLSLMAAEQARYQGLLAAVRRGEVDESRIEPISIRSRDLFREPLAAAKKAKRLRRDLTLDDVIPMLAMIDGALSAVSDRAQRQAAAERALEIIGAGIR